MRVHCRPALAGAALCASSIAAVANPVTVTTPFFNLEHRAVNSLGATPGEFLRIGADSVTPNFNAGTTGSGTTINLATGQQIPQVAILANGSPLSPNFVSRYLFDNPNLHGPWTLTFSNGSDTTTRTVSLPLGTTQAPFVNSITLGGTSANPEFSWTPPPNTTVNGYRVNIFDKANGCNCNIVSVNLQPSVTNYTVKASDFTVQGYQFQLDHDYSIEISLIQTKNNSSSNLSNGNIAAISRVYADFRPTMAAGPSVYLPVTLVDGSYQYNIAVLAGQTYYIDPLVAVGYDYRTGNGDPNFLSVVLPADIGDGKYDIYGLDAASNATLLARDWLGGNVFSFGAGGIDAFRIGGIEASAGLDPADVTAFRTGVAFTGNGMFTGTQTPIAAQVAIPEPETRALTAIGLALLGLARRGRPRRRS